MLFEQEGDSVRQHGEESEQASVKLPSASGPQRRTRKLAISPSTFSVLSVFSRILIA